MRVPEHSDASVLFYCLGFLVLFLASVLPRFLFLSSKLGN